MIQDLDLIVTVLATLFSVIATFTAGIFTYHKFIIRAIENVRKEMYKEISKLKEDSDERDKEIKESLKDLKSELGKRDEELKSTIKEMKDDLKDDLNFLRDKFLSN